MKFRLAAVFLGFFGSVSSQAKNSSLIIFPSGSINPIGYEAPADLRKKFRNIASEKAKERGIMSAKDCFSEDSDGYLRFCFIAYAEKALKQLPKNHPLKALAPEEHAAISWYADFGFQSYNSALWSQNLEELRQNELEIKLTLSALNRLPMENRQVVRCDLSDSTGSLSEEEILKVANRYTENSISLIKGFWSTSIGTDPSFIKQWIDPCYVQLNITLLGAGASIAELSSRPHEQEILVRPMTQFRVLQKNKLSKNGKTFFQIDLIQTYE